MEQKIEAVEEQIIDLENIIFDVSGTLSDDRLPIYLANNEMLRRYSRPTYTFAEWLVRTQLSAAEFLKNQGVEGDTDTLNRDNLEIYRNTSAANPAKIYDDVHEVLAYLKQRVGLAIVSSHPEESLTRELKGYRIYSYFSMVIPGAKDKAASLQKVLDAHQWSKTKTGYVGDTTFDIQAAQKVGMVSIGIYGTKELQRGYHHKERLAAEKPHVLIGTLHELYQYIKK